MNWYEVKIMTETPALEILCAMLTDTGVKGFVIQDKESFAEFLENKNGQWDYMDDDLLGLKNCDTNIVFYLPEDSQGAEQLISVRNLLAQLRQSKQAAFFGSLTLTCNQVKEEDWANNWKQYFKPLPVGKKLLIKPSWEEIPEQNDRLVLEIDPASSFGTGRHDTTRLCLELIEQIVKPHDKVLDLGCGSGILSIAAMILSAGQATAVDIMENSIRTAKENAERNHLSEAAYQTYCGDICYDAGLCKKIGTAYDFICANIVADVLIAMSDVFDKFLKPDGCLIVSGIIVERTEEVLHVLEKKGFTRIHVSKKDGWAAALLRKR